MGGPVFIEQRVRTETLRGRFDTLRAAHQAALLLSRLPSEAGGSFPFSGNLMLHL